MEKTWINANYFHNQLVVPCERTAFYLKFAKMSLKMFRKRCAWWSLKISVGRKRIDLSPQPPSTTPGRRTAPSVISKCRSHLTEVSKSSPTPKSLRVLQPHSTSPVVQRPQASQQLKRTLRGPLCETLEMLEKLPPAQSSKPPLESCSALWVKCLHHGTNGLLYTSVFKVLHF